MLRNLILLAIGLVFAFSGLALTANDTVRVEGGLISGSVVDGVRSYKGIPFAAPPVGELRWKAPQPVAAWEGVRECNDFGSDCPQTPYPQSSVYYSAPRRQSEDCLCLNVWTAAKAGEKRPVMVWIHGGALTRGSGATRAYDGTALAKKGVVERQCSRRLAAGQGIISSRHRPERRDVRADGLFKGRPRRPRLGGEGRRGFRQSRRR